ncbi:MAG: PKD domain-containing protein [Thaumarchaeota archaeon]|nr:PKD domain-containing protein [Nitrososphaerota archaeon]
MVLSFSGTVEDVFAQAPIANAGPDQIVASGATVTLDASGSTNQDGTKSGINHFWGQVSGPTVNISQTGTVPTAIFVAPTGPAKLVLQVNVFNSGSEIVSDTVTITVLAPPRPPVADAGPDQTVKYGDTVTLDGRGSTDPDGDQITYSWAHASGLTANPTGSNTSQPTFTAPSSTGMITFTLTVSDGALSDTDDVIITVTPPLPPIADAGLDQTVRIGDIITLDGSNSSDPNSDPLTYMWEQSSGTPVSITSPTSEHITLSAPDSPGKLVFTLTVSDGTDSDTDDITITIAKPVTRNIKEMSDTLVSAKITAPNQITMIYNEELSTFINSYLNFTISGEDMARNMIGIDGSPSKSTVANIDGDDTNVFVTILTFDGQPAPSNSTGTMYIQHADHYLAFIQVSDGQD